MPDFLSAFGTWLRELTCAIKGHDWEDHHLQGGVIAGRHCRRCLYRQFDEGPREVKW